MMMIKRMTATTTPMIAIIFMFCHLLKIVSPLVEFGELAIPLQHLLHIDPHDVHYFPDLRLRLRQSRVPLLWSLSHPEPF